MKILTAITIILCFASTQVKASLITIYCLMDPDCEEFYEQNPPNVAKAICAALSTTMKVTAVGKFYDSKTLIWRTKLNGKDHEPLYADITFTHKNEENYVAIDVWDGGNGQSAYFLAKDMSTFVRSSHNYKNPNVGGTQKYTCIMP